MDSDGGGPETVCCETLLRWRGQGETILLRSEISCQVCFMVSMETNSDMFKGWMMRQIFFGLSESVCLKTYLSRIKVHTEQGM